VLLFVSLIAVIALVAIVLTSRAQGLDLRKPGDIAALFRPRVLIEVAGQAMAVPRPEPADGRVLPAVPVTSTGSYAFLNTEADGGPVGYDPCRPVRYVVRTAGAPPGGEALVTEAVADLSADTGLSFEYVGTTDEAPALDRPLIQPDRYGTDWAPVLIAWATAREVPALAGDVAGIGGSAAVPGADGKGEWLAAGRLVLDSDDLGAMIADGDPAAARSVVLHELGHVVGLDHVDDRNELMYPMTSTRLDFGPGDREGLALLGQVACQG
jgi:hypothetical protein